MQNDRYLLLPRDAAHGPKLAAFFHPDASTDDMLRAILHAALLREALLARSIDMRDPSGLAALRSAMKETRTRGLEEFDAFREALAARGWRTDELCFADQGHRVMWK